LPYKSKEYFARELGRVGAMGRVGRSSLIAKLSMVLPVTALPLKGARGAHAATVRGGRRTAKRRTRRAVVAAATVATTALAAFAVTTAVGVSGASAAPVTPQTTQGTDFWLTFEGNYDGQMTTLYLFAAGDTATTGTVSEPGIQFSQDFTVTPGTVTQVMVPTNGEDLTSDTVGDYGIHVTAADPVSIYGLNTREFSTDGFLGLPTDILGQHYIVEAYTNDLGADSPPQGGSQFSVVGTADGTNVTIDPSETVGDHTAGTPYTVQLNQGQTYQLNDGAVPNGDLTGTDITSDKPVAVFGGNNCADVPSGVFYCNILTEELPPVTAWGSSFVTEPLAGRTADTFRFLASTDNTTVQVNGTTVATLSAHQFYETELSTASVITSSNPILVTQFSNGSTYDNAQSDPFSVTVPPSGQFLNSYTVTTEPDGADAAITANYINVVAPSSEVGSVTLDGTAIPASDFTAIPGSSFSGAQVAVAFGSHVLGGPLPFGLTVYGEGNDDGYGYPGGFTLSPIATVSKVSLAVGGGGTAPVGGTATTTATVTDQNGNPVSGVRVDFTVTGANAQTGFAYTDSSGNAVFTYTGTNVGTDSITAAVQSIMSSPVTWTWTAKAATPTTTTTQLAAGTTTGTAITVPAGTAVTDTATLSGTNAATATGTITYNVYSDNACTKLVSTGAAQKITAPGTPPPSAPVTLTAAGTYYWTASYSGDASNLASVSPCAGEGGESETVTAAQTTLATSLAGGTATPGVAITVPAGTPVTDSATLTGAVASGATGTVTYNVYTDDTCTTLVKAGSAEKITTPGVLPASAPVTLTTTGTYYWTASYSGDASNLASASNCGTERLTVGTAATTLATSLSGGNATPGTAITVPQGTAVTDSATLAGTAASGATGTVTYNVYSDSKCTALVNGGSAEKITTPGTLPASAAVTLTGTGTYYWTASYSGDANNQASVSACGSETETVSAVAQPTTLATSLSGGGKTGTQISVTAGTAVTDSATVSGTNAATATGTVTYNVYSDIACTKLVKGGTAEKIVTPGTLPGSAAVTLAVAGTYYWQVAYSGDTHNQASLSPCDSDVNETEVVTAATTTVSTSLSGGGKSGTAITVESGTAVTDTATLSGVVASGATGTVTFNVYSDSACTKLAAAGGQVVVSGGKVPASLAVTLKTAGKYYWTATYSGDASDLKSASACGAETMTITPAPSVDSQTTAFSASSTTAKVTTTVAGDILVALVGARGPVAGGQTVTVSGGGLTWHLAGRENAGQGDAEIWTATASAILKAVSVKATAKTSGFTVTMTIVALEHATGTGALAKATATTGAPKVTLKTTHIDAWVIAMGDNWAHAVTPTAVTGQYLVSRVTDSTDTFWAQATSPLVATAGTSVTISDSAPTTNPWDLFALEVF
jgi:hypothetical protein